MINLSPVPSDLESDCSKHRKVREEEAGTSIFSAPFDISYAALEPCNFQTTILARTFT